MGAAGTSAFGAQTASAQANNSAVVESTSSIQSDEIGNIIDVDGMEFVWEGRQLQSIGANGTPFSYEYNIDGQRTKKTVTDFDTGETPTTEYFYNSGMLMGQKTGNDVLVFMYDESGDMFGFTYNGTPYYYVKNAQNDVWAVTNADGQAVVLYFYDAWGKVTRSYEADGYEAIAQINPILYRSYYFDAETGFYYVSSRYYDPEVGRYLNADSVLSGTGESVQGYNLFAYCFNNPVNMSDSSGHWPKWIENAANWVNNNIVQPVANFFSPKTNTISGQFQDGIFRGSGSLTGGYSEFNGRLQINSKDSKNNGMLGGYGKVSVGNASGKIGIGNDNAALSVKGVGDALTATAQAGIQYKNGVGLAAKAKAAVLSGRATAELELFGWQIEFGVSGDLLSVGAEAMIGVFPDEGFTAKASVGAGVFGGGFVFRVKPKQ